jgi:hypothetical protein
MLERLVVAGVPLAGVIVNRVHLWPAAGATPDRVPEADRRDVACDALARALREDAADPAFPAEAAARAALDCADGYAEWVRSDEQSTRELTARVARHGGFVRRVPELPADVHDLEGLASVSEWVFGAEANATRQREAT